VVLAKTKKITFKPLRRKRLSCNYCRRKGITAISKQGQTDMHRAVHRKAVSPPKSVSRKIPPISPSLESIGRIEPQEDTERPPLKANERECIHCKYRFFGNKVYCPEPECRKKWYQ